MSNITSLHAEDLRLHVSTSARILGSEPDSLIPRWSAELRHEGFDASGNEEVTTIGQTRLALIDSQRLESVFDALDAADSDWNLLNPHFTDHGLLEGPFKRVLLVDRIEVNAAFRRQGWGGLLVRWTLAELCRHTRDQVLIATIPDFNQPWLQTWLDGIGFNPPRNADGVWLYLGDLPTAEQLEAAIPLLNE